MEFCEKREPLVSIVMPSYNSAKYVERSVISAMNQSYGNLELVFVDDGSTDSSLEIVRKIAAEDSRINIRNNVFDKGATGARNSGVHYSSGFYTAFLDSDDLWHPEKLENQIRFMRENNVNFSYCDYEMFMENPDRKKLIRSPKQVQGTDILKKCDIGCLTAVVESKLLGEQPFRSRHKEDYALWVDLIYNQKITAHHCGGCYAFYRKLQGSRSGQKLREINKQYYVLRNTAGLRRHACIKYLLSYIVNGLVKHRFP